MQRYELVDGASNKFWEVEVAGADLKVTFGRIGTTGQTKNKNFGDAATAQREHDKLVREKTGKGYVLATGLQVAAPALPPIAKPPAQQAPVTASVPASPDGIRWPAGGVQWRSEWTTRMPVVRGLHAPALPAPEVAPDVVPPEVLTTADPALWAPLLNTARTNAWKLGGQRFHLALTRHGAAFGLRALSQCWTDTVAANGPEWGVLDHVPLLAQAVAVCPDGDYPALLACAEELRAAGGLPRRLCALAFRHVSAWAIEAAEGLHDWQTSRLLMATQLPPEEFDRLVRSYPRYRGGADALPGALLQLRVHGEAALLPLGTMLREAVAERRAGDVEAVVQMVTRIRTPAMLRLLAGQTSDRKVRDALAKVAQEFPAAVLQSLAEEEAADGGLLVQLALLHDGPLQSVLALLAPRERQRLQAQLAPFAVREAAADRLPAILREPPWLRADRRQLPALEVAVLPTPEVLVLDAQQRARAEAEPKPTFTFYDDGRGFPGSMGITDQGARALLAGEPLPEDGVDGWNGRQTWLTELFHCPAHLRLALWNQLPARKWSRWYDESDIHHLFVRHGFAAMPGLLGWFRLNPDHAAHLAPAFDSGQLVPFQLQQMLRGKQQREAAAQWVRAHARTVLHVALPAAFRAEGSVERDDARQALRFLVAEGHAPLAREVAALYGPAMEQALTVLVTLDPLELLPATLPKPPAFLVPTAVRRPVLVEGGALPAPAVRHLATMLALGAPDAPYPGVAQVQAACTPESLADFAWDLLDAWCAAGAPPKEGWVLRALAVLGNDSIARRLAPRIREWAEQGAPARGLAALEVLAALGTDIALMHLNLFARQNRIKPLQKRAMQLIAGVAEARGLDEDELGDRLVPTLGLDEDGALELDYGPRRFRVRFDEALAPYITDMHGVRQKAIPRPVKTDDAARAKAAVERYKHMRKEATALASLQVARLERAMAAQRRWSAADFRQFFLAHPLMRHLAARLVWGVYQEGTLTACFRIAEDASLADVDDRTWTLAQDAQVGLPHVLHLSGDAHAAWSTLFADYEIAQPFRQLGRETHALADADLALATLQRFVDRRVASVALLALQHRGWTRQSDDGAAFTACTRELANGLCAQIRFTPGLPIGAATTEPVQTLGKLTLYERDARGGATAVPWQRLDPLAASEVLRDLELLAPARH